jgi:hypothetical protein
MMSRRVWMVIAGAIALHATPAPAIGQSLDFELFKTRVEPVFLKKRPDHARCYVCHSQGNNAFRLEKLSPGAKFWTDEQSHRNFEVASALVVPGVPDSSLLLLQPLAPEAGGNVYHSGGRQFASKNDSDWKILAQWVKGQTQAAHPGK